MSDCKLQGLVNNIKQRQKYLLDIKGEKPDKRNKAWMLWDADPTELIELTYGHVLTGIERKSTLTQIISSMGGCINRRLKLKVDEITEVHIGWFVFVAYIDCEILSYKTQRQVVKGKLQKHATYAVKVLDLDALNDVMNLVREESVDLFPCQEPPTDWDGKFVHQSLGHPLIKHAHEEAIKQANNSDLTYLEETLNKLQNTGWRINKPVFEVFKKCMTDEKNPFKFAKEVDAEKKASLLIEIKSILALAEKNLDKTFYHLYNCDFRGRIYPNTAFLHEQSSDNSKGILMFDEPVPLGDSGYFWFCVHAANMWGNDKVSLRDRNTFIDQEMKEKMLQYADEPMSNTGWMEADKPFCFLACCYEMMMIEHWTSNGHQKDSFPSCLPVYIDGSNNGVQHLVAMSKDEEVAPLVNLVPQKLPGDVYMFIAKKVRENVMKDLKAMDPSVVAKFHEIYSRLVELKADVNKYLPGSELHKQAVSRLKEFSNQTYDTKKQLGPVFWSQIKDDKIWRKTVKRPVMTLGYGGTKYGMVDMVHEDTRDINDYLRDKDKSWSGYLGNLIFRTCYEELKGAAQMLSMFEELAVRENDNDRPISFRQIVTNFPFVHSYREAQSKRVKLYYGEDVLDITVQIWREATLKKSKQKTGAAPNIVHSVDAVHLSMYIHDTDYPVTVVHDSFGCHAGNMNRAFMDVRRKFVELYEMEPLEYILEQMDSLDLIPEKGDLDVRRILESDYAFA